MERTRTRTKRNKTFVLLDQGNSKAGKKNSYNTLKVLNYSKLFNLTS